MTEDNVTQDRPEAVGALCRNKGHIISWTAGFSVRSPRDTAFRARVGGASLDPVIGPTSAPWV